MTRLAFRNLFQNKARLVISVGGVGLALLLILALDAIFAGAERRVTAYIDSSASDIIVAQSGVRNMHMASSSLPDSVRRKVGAVPGVRAVLPIDYVASNVVIGDERNLAYVVGLPEDAAFGGAWQVASGRSLPAEGEAIIDRGIAEKSAIALGDEVEILGEDFRIAGFSEGTSSLVNSVAFISAHDFEELRRSYGTFSFLLVQVQPGESASEVVERIHSRVRDVTAQTTPDFAAQERRVIRDMSTDVIAIMNAIGFLIGLAVMALTVYTSALARRREYGMLKALGARNLDLSKTVVMQAFLSVVIGYAFGLGVTLLLALVVPRLGSNLTLEVTTASLMKVGVGSLVIASVAALAPIRQIAGLPPAMVFRGA
jgi:putative ABC transport system permease protein